VGLLGGGIEVKEVKIPPVPIIPRAASFVVGCILLGLVLWDPGGALGLRNPEPEVSGPKTTPTDKGRDLGAAFTHHLIEVYDVKRVLQHIGMYTGPINNEPDDVYFLAVANFQRSRNIVQDGLVGGETFGKLREAWPEYFGPSAPPPPANLASNDPGPMTSPTPPPPEAKPPEAKPPEAKPPEPKIYLQSLIYPQAFRILYVKGQEDFAARLHNYLASKGYKTAAVYDDFSEIKQDGRAKPGTIRIVYKSTVEAFEPTLTGFMRTKFPSETGRLIESLNEAAASDLQIQLW
jgi:hypothetical protein